MSNFDINIQQLFETTICFLNIWKIFDQYMIFSFLQTFITMYIHSIHIKIFICMTLKGVL